MQAIIKVSLIVALYDGVAVAVNAKTGTSPLGKKCACAHLPFSAASYRE